MTNFQSQISRRQHRLNTFARAETYANRAIGLNPNQAIEPVSPQTLNDMQVRASSLNGLAKATVQLIDHNIARHGSIMLTDRTAQAVLRDLYSHVRYRNLLQSLRIGKITSALYRDRAIDKLVSIGRIADLYASRLSALKAFAQPSAHPGDSRQSDTNSGHGGPLTALPRSATQRDGHSGPVSTRDAAKASKRKKHRQRGDDARSASHTSRNKSAGEQGYQRSGGVPSLRTSIAALASHQHQPALLRTYIDRVDTCIGTKAAAETDYKMPATSAMRIAKLGLQLQASIRHHMQVLQSPRLTNAVACAVLRDLHENAEYSAMLTASGMHAIRSPLYEERAVTKLLAIAYLVEQARPRWRAKAALASAKSRRVSSNSGEQSLIFKDRDASNRGSNNVFSAQTNEKAGMFSNDLRDQHANSARNRFPEYDVNEVFQDRRPTKFTAPRGQIQNQNEIKKLLDNPQLTDTQKRGVTAYLRPDECDRPASRKDATALHHQNERQSMTSTEEIRNYFHDDKNYSYSGQDTAFFHKQKMEKRSGEADSRDDQQSDSLFKVAESLIRRRKRDIQFLDASFMNQSIQSSDANLSKFNDDPHIAQPSDIYHMVT